MNVTYRSVEVENTTLRGTFSRPDGNGPHPVVVMHHGFGANRIEAMGLFPQLSRRLTARGIATVAFDRAGHGESDGTFFDTTVSRDIRQAHQVIAAVLAESDFDLSHVHLLGMSMGSIVASVVAAETSLPVRSLTLWSPAAIFHDDAASGNFQGRPVGEQLAAGFLDNNGSRLGTAFFDDARTFDPYARATGFPGQARVISGGADEIVPAHYAERYAEVYSDRGEITIVPGADHLWASVPVRERLMDETVRFITAVSGVAG